MEQLQDRVLGALKHGDKERYTYALSFLQTEHFTEYRQRLFLLMCKLYQITRTPPDAKAIALALNGLKAQDLATELLSIFASLDGKEITESEFRAAVYQLDQSRLDGEFMNTLSTGLQINARPTWIQGRELFGRDEARQFIIANLQGSHSDEASDMSNAVYDDNTITEDYKNAKAGKVDFLQTGIHACDRIITGLERGDLMVIEGFLGEGKTTLALNIAHNAMLAGKNVLYGTTETVKKRVHRKLVCRHSYEPQFKQPIPNSDLKFGRLTPQQETILTEVNASLRNNHKAGKYGAFYITSIGGSLDGLKQAADVAQSLCGSLDLIVADYLAHMTTKSERVVLVDLIKETKAFAVTFNNRRGVPIITPWQTGLDKWEAAKKVGHYKKGSMADTLEIERTADIVHTILRDPDNELFLINNYTKVRDDADGGIFKLKCDLSYSYIGDESTARGTRGITL